MSESKLIFKNNQIDVQFWDKESGNYKTGPIDFMDFASYYEDGVEFDKDLTVEGFMTALEPYFSIIDEHFIAYTRGHELRHYFIQMQQPSNKMIFEDEIEFVEIFWASEIYQHDNLIEGKIEKEFNLYGGFHGVAKDMNYGLGMSPINKWKHYPLKINDTIKCTSFIDSKLITVFEATKSFTFYEILRYFFFELTWYGYTEDMEKLSDRLSNLYDSVMESEDFHTFKQQDMFQMQIDSLESDLKECLESDNFEGAARIRDKIIKLKEKRND